MTAETRRFRFLQVSDVHLDSHLSIYKLPFTPPERQERSREIVETFLLAIEVAKQEAVDAVLIPGNLWDNDSLSNATALKVIKGFEDLHDISVIISPGPLDCYSSESLYNPKNLRARGLPPWPDNVVIFNQEQFTAVPCPTLPAISFTGRAVTGRYERGPRILQTDLPRNDRAILNLMIAHGAVVDLSIDDDEAQADKMPVFSHDQLESQQFNYAALGHYTDFAELQSVQGEVIAAYAGRLTGTGFDVLGPRYGLLGTLEPDASGLWLCTIDPIELDRRRMIMVGLDISGLDNQEIVEELVMSIEDQGGRADRDLIYVHLEGSYKLGNDTEAVLAGLRDRYLHLVVVNNTRPDYLSANLDHRTTEWKYIQSLLEMKRNTEIIRSGEFDTTQSEPSISRDIVEDALYYGLDALKHKKVTVRDVD